MELTSIVPEGEWATIGGIEVTCLKRTLSEIWEGYRTTLGRASNRVWQGYIHMVYDYFGLPHTGAGTGWSITAQQDKGNNS